MQTDEERVEGDAEFAERKEHSARGRKERKKRNADRHKDGRQHFDAAAFFYCSHCEKGCGENPHDAHAHDAGYAFRNDQSVQQKNREQNHCGDKLNARSFCVGIERAAGRGGSGKDRSAFGARTLERGGDFPPCRIRIWLLGKEALIPRRFRAKNIDKNAEYESGHEAGKKKKRSDVARLSAENHHAGNGNLCRIVRKRACETQADIRHELRFVKERVEQEHRKTGSERTRCGKDEHVRKKRAGNERLTEHFEHDEKGDVAFGHHRKRNEDGKVCQSEPHKRQRLRNRVFDCGKKKTERRKKRNARRLVCMRHSASIAYRAESNNGADEDVGTADGMEQETREDGGWCGAGEKREDGGRFFVLKESIRVYHRA